MIVREVKEFVAGFFDGDGCVSLRPPRRKDPRPMPIVRFAQSRNCGVPLELEYIQRVYGGTVKSLSPTNLNSKTQWQLIVSDRGSLVGLLGDLEEFAILKADQASLALKRLKPVTDEQVGEIARMMRNMHQKSSYLAVDIDTKRITPAYLAGFFAAEGHVGVFSRGHCVTLHSTLTQWNSPKLLDAIRQYLGYGSLHDGELHFAAQQSERFFSLILPFLEGQKKKQVEIALDYQRRKPCHRRKTREEQEWIDGVVETIKKLKKE
jgi:hypothetical protein